MAGKKQKISQKQGHEKKTASQQSPGKKAGKASSHPQKEEPVYDVVIVGGGISGAALLYVLDNYSDVGKILLLEKRKGIALLNSGTHSNSQTLHFGDIETNYSAKKSRIVKDQVTMTMNYLHRYGDDRMYKVFGKMVLAVGDQEIKALRQRFKEIKSIYPDLKPIDAEEISKIEPLLTKGRGRSEKILALYTKKGYAVDYQRLAKSYIENSKQNGSRVKLGHEVTRVEKKGEHFVLHAKNGKFIAKAICIAAGGMSLGLARQLGYGRNFSIAPVEGGFFFAKGRLRSKVYTMQIKKLPFAAIHADPEVDNPARIRFGPTANILLWLEKGDMSTFWDYLKILSPRTFLSYGKILLDFSVSGFMLRSMSYNIPFFGKRGYVRQAQKIIPSLSPDDIKPAKGYGGIRPQIINLTSKTFETGEIKLRELGAVFNVTPSPGASVSLHSAGSDAEFLVAYLKKRFDKKRFYGDFTKDKY